MPSAVLQVHAGLLASARVPALSRAGRTISAAELAALVLIGAGAALLSVALPDGRLAFRATPSSAPSSRWRLAWPWCLGGSAAA